MEEKVVDVIIKNPIVAVLTSAIMGWWLIKNLLIPLFKKEKEDDISLVKIVLQQAVTIDKLASFVAETEAEEDQIQQAKDVQKT